MDATELQQQWMRWRHDLHRWPENGFNDQLLPIGARYFAEPARIRLPRASRN